MAMIRGANGILTRTLCVNHVDLGVTWSSNKGSMVHGEALNTWPCPMLPVFEFQGVGMPTSLGWPRHFGGGFPMHILLHEVTFA